MTLVEMMISIFVGMAVLAAVASIIVMVSKTIYKNQLANDASTNTRQVQEHLNRELSRAISMVTPVRIVPTFGGRVWPDAINPVRHARINYRVSVGSYAKIVSNASNSATSVTIYCPPDLQPMPGDMLLCDYPNLLTGVRITAVTGTVPGNVQLTLASTIDAATDPSAPTSSHVGMTVLDPAHPQTQPQTIVSIQRDRRYETTDPGTGTLCELHWFQNVYNADGTENGNYVVLSRNVEYDTAHTTDPECMFGQVPPETTLPAPAENSIRWQYSYLSSFASSMFKAGGKETYYQTNYAEGLISPKSGNPLNVSPISGITTSTTTSTTSSSTTSTTSSTSTTSTSVATTNSTTSTTSSISTSSTSSTSTTSTSQSTTSSTSTTSTSQSSTSTTSSTSVSTTSTSQSTTSSTSSTSIATTQSTTSTTSSTPTTSSTTSSSTSVTSTSIGDY